MKNQIVNGNTLFSILAVVLMVFAVQGVTFAQEEPPLRPFTFEVTLTNLTEGAPGQAGQVFSPPFIVTHAPRERFVQMGESASDELRILAEDGANGPIAVLAEGLDFVLDVLALDGPLPPGESVTVMILGGPGGPHLSLATMLVQTNDGIAAADSLDLFDENLEPRTFTIDLMAYDAGTEENNELATHVPGPPFGGGERMPEADVIRPHPGISGDADVGLEFGWEGPVARLTVVPIAEAPRVVVPSPIDTFDFKVTLTNLTEGAPGQAGQVFSPPLIVTHALRERFVQMGESASDELRILAEDGANGPLAALAEGLDLVREVVALDGPLPPGASVTAIIEGGPRGGHLSLTTMLVQTNDGIAAADSLDLFDENAGPRAFSIDLMAYDAGTEQNNEFASHVPGPPFGGGERAPEADVIRPHPGISGDGDIGLEFGWEGPVARLTVTPLGPRPEIIAQGYAVLSGAQEVPAVDTEAAGTAALQLDANLNLHFSITVTGLSGPITGAHFHGPAPEGENTGVIFPFITEPFEGEHIEGVWEGLTGEGLDYLFEGLLYLNIHTAANPPGEIRGQVHMGENGVAFLSGDAQVHDVETDGAGTGAFKLIDDGTALWFNITVTGLSGPITGAHFHGPAGEDENAGVIFPFITEPFEGEHIEGIWPELTDEALEYLQHEGVYVNIHTAANPPGEIRGQVIGPPTPGPGLGPEPGEPISLGYAVLDVEQEIPAPAVDTDPVGTALFVIDKNHDLFFNITVTGLSGPITGAHFHGPAPAGENAAPVKMPVSSSTLPIPSMETMPQASGKA